MTIRTREELLTEMKLRFGDDDKAWAFKCPACGDIANGYDFIEACGGDGEKAADRIGQECIGRTLGALKKGSKKYTGRGCDWAAYGLFAGPDFMILTREDGTEKKIPCFEIAPAPVEQETTDAS